MTVRDIIDMVNSGEITNLDTEIVCSGKSGKYYQVEWYELGEYGLDSKEIYDQIDTQESILILG